MCLISLLLFLKEHPSSYTKSGSMKLWFPTVFFEVVDTQVPRRILWIWISDNGAWLFYQGPSDFRGTLYFENQCVTDIQILRVNNTGSLIAMPFPLFIVVLYVRSRVKCHFYIMPYISSYLLNFILAGNITLTPKENLWGWSYFEEYPCWHNYFGIYKWGVYCHSDRTEDDYILTNTTYWR